MCLLFSLISCNVACEEIVSTGLILYFYFILQNYKIFITNDTNTERFNWVLALLKMECWPLVKGAIAWLIGFCVTFICKKCIHFKNTTNKKSTCYIKTNVFSCNKPPKYPPKSCCKVPLMLISLHRHSYKMRHFKLLFRHIWLIIHPTHSNGRHY